MSELEKKQTIEYQDLYDLFFKTSDKLPSKFLYVSEDSFEFDLLVDYYKSIMKKQGAAFEVVVYVSETGDLEKFISELFSMNMFSQNRLCVIKSGSDFLKPLLSSNKEKYYEELKAGLSKITDETILLVHYDSKEIPLKLKKLFSDGAGYIKSRNYFPNEARNSLERILKHEKISMDIDAIDEFIYKTPPSFGTYLRSIKKLKSYFGKKHFSLLEVKELLSATTDYNPDQLVEFLFSNSRFEFFKEFSKIRPDSTDTDKLYLRLLNRLLEKNNEIRKAKILLKKFRSKDDENEFYKLMGMESYSPARKKFVRSKLIRETEIFSDKAISYLYESLIEMNFQFKASSIKDKQNFYFIQKMEKLFLILSANN
ncbi:MAG: DNA polymerase III subunit delta [Leptospiraceae bacterium]|nr:DNA polymerase III subunit delta [Leptospiraceae bacterium]MCK6380057.1 DNA polymerase III subunit delta [Leptospiraceae bacterium]NUM40650.1 DNA polymerase III subunit delta [Leptospiraceae bacterium]